MTTPYADNTQVIDGAGEAFQLDSDANQVLTHASTACTTTVLTMATDPRLKFRPGDVIKVTTSGTDFRRIASLTATTITLEAALPSAPSTGVAIVREWRLLGQTQGGIVIGSKLSTQERMSDQFTDAFNVKGDKRETTVNLPLIEYDPLNVTLALGLTAAAVTKSGTKTRIGIGAGTSNLNESKLLIIGQNLDGDWVTCLIHKAVNEGDAQIRFAKEANSVLGLNMKVLLDTTQPVGYQLFMMDIDTAPDYNVHNDVGAA